MFAQKAAETSRGRRGRRLAPGYGPAYDRAEMERSVDATPGLLERDAELDTLSSLMGTVRAGSGCVAAVEGPAGIGKSSLL